MSNKVVFIGWHGADWRSLHPLVDAGLMPNLRALIERGVIGTVRALGPANPAILFTSIATGRTADHHGVLSGFEADPLSGALRDISSTARTAQALWSIAGQSGLRAHVVGWAATHPAEEVSGACITPQFAKVVSGPGQPWPVAERSVHPVSLAATMADLRVHLGELTGDDLLPFLPKLSEIDQEHDTRAIELAELLARAISLHGAATWLLENDPADLVMLGWDVLELACYRFLPFTPPRLPFVDEQDYALYNGVIQGIFCFYDMLLGRIVQLAGPEATVVIASPTGFRIGDERPSDPEWRQNPGAWVRGYGMLAMAGPGIRPDHLVHGVTNLDLAPTLLAILGLPASTEMPGRIITEAFNEAPALPRIDTWEPSRPAPPIEDTAAEAIRQLAALGYEVPPEHPNQALVRRNQLLNRGLAALSAERYAPARAAFDQLAAEAPDQHQFRLWQAYTQYLCADHAACRQSLRSIPPQGLLGAMAGLLEAHLEGDSELGLEAVRRAGELASTALICYLTGALYMRLGQWDESERQLRRAIELDPSFQPAHDLLSRVMAARGQTAEAVQSALQALEIDYGSAFSHYVLGLALIGGGDEQRALLAFEQSRAFNPRLQQARLWSAAIRLREAAAR